MRKIVVAFCLLASVVAAKAQDSRSNAVKINPLSLALATGNVAYERALGENTSIQLGGFYSGVSLGDVKYTGFGVVPEFRYYFAGAREALNGVYVGPFARYQQFKFTDKTTNDNVSLDGVGGGAVMGWEKSWNSGFVLDLYAGPSFSSVKVKGRTSGETDLYGKLDGFGVRVGLRLGFAF